MAPEHGAILEGAAVIAAAIAARIRSLGVLASTRNIEWNDGRPLVRAPNIVKLKLRLPGGPPLMRVFRRSNLADAVHGVPVRLRSVINQVAEEYVKVARGKLPFPPNVHSSEHNKGPLTGMGSSASGPRAARNSVSNPEPMD